MPSPSRSWLALRFFTRSIVAVTFASLAQPAVEPLIERFSGAPQITLVVGAGASMEAELPSWPELIERLLERIADDHPRLVEAADRRDWIRRTLERDELLGAGAVVEVMAESDLDTLLPKALYGDAGPREPGPIARQVAQLRQRFGDRVTILTTNYDDLIERALLTAGFTKSQVKSYVRRRKDPPAGAVPVTHLHGFAGRDGASKNLILTEEHYHKMQRGHSWQEEYVTDRLENSLCLFIGTSLTDPNLIRYLYGYNGAKRTRHHAAVFVRQGDLDDATATVRAAREEAIGKRWRRCGVETVFVDHFADGAQLLHEIAHRRAAGDAYESFPARSRHTLELIKRDLFAIDGDDERFVERQVTLSGWLRSHLYNLVNTALGGEGLLGDERLALALWLLGPDGMTLTGWAHSDRAHQDLATIEAVPIAAGSEWVAVRTICKGVRVELDRENAVSRWRFVRGLPLVLDEPTRMPVGCLTISSTKPGLETILNRLDANKKAALHGGLTTAVIKMIQELPELAEDPIAALR